MTIVKLGELPGLPAIPADACYSSEEAGKTPSFNLGSTCKTFAQSENFPLCQSAPAIPVLPLIDSDKPPCSLVCSLVGSSATARQTSGGGDSSSSYPRQVDYNAALTQQLDTILFQMDENLSLTRAIYKKTLGRSSVWRRTSQENALPGGHHYSPGRASVRLDRWSVQMNDPAPNKSEADSQPPMPSIHSNVVGSASTGKTIDTVNSVTPRSSGNKSIDYSNLLDSVGSAGMSKKPVPAGMPSCSELSSHDFTEALTVGRGCDSPRLAKGPSYAFSHGSSFMVGKYTHSSAEWDATLSDLKSKVTQETSLPELTKFIMQRDNMVSQRAAMVWRFLEDKNSSCSAYAYFYIRGVFVFFSVLLAWMDFIDADSASSALFSNETAWTCQIAIEVLFILELIMRFVSCRDRSTFWFSFYNIIDLLSACPLFLRVWLRFETSMEDSVWVTSMLGVAPVIRLMKVLRYFDTFQLLIHSFITAVSALPVLLFAFFLLSNTFAAVVYYFEPREVIGSLPEALYFVIITISTVGYGDIYPVTVGGKIVTTMLIVAGSLYLAIPIGIVGKAFGDVWEDRHRLLVLQKMRRCVECAGYTKNDFELLFSLFDKNGDNQLDLDEFNSLLETMRVNRASKLVQSVFDSFEDDSDGGCVDFPALVNGLFPSSTWIRF